MGGRNLQLLFSDFRMLIQRFGAKLLSPVGNRTTARKILRESRLENKFFGYT